MLDFNCGIEMDEEVINPVIKKESVESILSTYNNAISFDIAKNHTGVCVWRDGKLETLGFENGIEYDKSDNMSEAKMRLWLKNKCKEIMGYTYFDVCQVEGVFGGENFDTTRKLIALNGVVAELILENQVNVGRYYNLIQKEWAKDFRQIIKIGKALSSKYETQEILKYLDFDFVLSNCDKSDSYKKDIFYEDICDAVGMLCGVALREKFDLTKKPSSGIKLSDIKMYFIEDLDDLYVLRNKDKVLADVDMIALDTKIGSEPEEVIKSLVMEHPDNVINILVGNNELGRFGVKHNFPFYEQGYGNLVFYDKKLKRRC